jgi:hypothetical protein
VSGNNECGTESVFVIPAEPLKYGVRELDEVKTPATWKKVLTVGVPKYADALADPWSIARMGGLLNPFQFKR